MRIKDEALVGRHGRLNDECEEKNKKKDGEKKDEEKNEKNDEETAETQEGTQLFDAYMSEDNDTSLGTHGDRES